MLKRIQNVALIRRVLKDGGEIFAPVMTFFAENNETRL